MDKINILDALGKKSKPDIIKEIINNPSYTEELIEGIDNKNKIVKNKCLKILNIISELKPEYLYHKFDLFADLLDSDDNIKKWNAIIIISNLAIADRHNKIEKIYVKYFNFLSDKTMITASNVAKSAGMIGAIKSDLADYIATELIKVENYSWDTDECRNVIIGQVIDSLAMFFGCLTDQRTILKFVRRQLTNERAATKNKAERFLKKNKMM